MVNLEQIYGEVDKLDRNKIMDIIKTLIKVNTSVPPANTYREYVDVISPYFKDLGFNLEEVIVPEELLKDVLEHLEGPRINLVATKDYGQKKDITFYGHMDVVPAPSEGEETWRFPPFEATMIKSGKIYGRGVADMKGAMAALILALQIIEKLNLTPKYNICVLNCTDEEIGIYPGVQYLAEQGYIKGTIFCMELSTDPIIPTGLAGFLDVIVETFGRSCHSGMNFLGVNALEEMIPILDELIKLKKIVEERESEDIPGLPRPGMKKVGNMSPMFNLDIIKSGEKSNIVPDYCQLIINRRIIPEENYEDVKEEILTAIEKGKARSKALNVKTKFLYRFPSLRVNTNSSGMQRMKKVMSLVQNVPEEKIQIMGFAGSTDMGHVSQVLNTNDFILHGVANLGSHAHGVNETIKLKDFKTFMKEVIVYLCADL
jgi:succinyl-diaminopimelate desuccinylase